MRREGEGEGLFISFGLIWEMQPQARDIFDLLVLTSSFQSWTGLLGGAWDAQEGLHVPMISGPRDADHREEDASS